MREHGAMSEEKDETPEEPGTRPIDSILDFIGTVAEEIQKARVPDLTRRPKQLWVRWRVLPDMGPNAIEIIGCMMIPFPGPLGENEYEGSFR